MEITPAHRAALEKIADSHRLCLIVLFGSHAGGVTHESSDLDIAVLTRDRQGLSSSSWLALLDDLREVFPDAPVDLAVLDHADPLFLKQVTGRCVLLAGRERDLHEFRMYAYRRYQDHKPYLALERRFAEALAGNGAAAR